MPHTVLVVEDDAALRALIDETLTEVNFRVVKAENGKKALEVFHAFKPDIAVLDIGLEDMSGIDLCRQIHSFRNIPIIFLTGRDSEFDQLIGFASGADDYITKPFSPKLLAARIDAIIRRKSSESIDKSRFKVGPLELDLESRTLKVSGEEIPVTRIEFDLLSPLIINPERVVSREELVEIAWGNWFGDTHVIESHISRLRSKIKKAGGPVVCEAVRGVGYKLGVKD